MKKGDQNVLESVYQTFLSGAGAVALNPLWTGNPYMGTLANSEDP